MNHSSKTRAERVAARKVSQDANLFSRLPAAAVASRGQAQRLLLSSARLSIIEWRILWDLVEAGPLSIQDMASIQRTDHSLISRALPSMREKGYIKTARNAEDKRQSVVELTETGLHAFQKAAPVMKRRREGLADAFSASELETLLALLSRFETFLDTHVDAEPAVAQAQ